MTVLEVLSVPVRVLNISDYFLTTIFKYPAYSYHQSSTLVVAETNQGYNMTVFQTAWNTTDDAGRRLSTAQPDATQPQPTITFQHKGDLSVPSDTTIFL